MFSGGRFLARGSALALALALSSSCSRSAETGEASAVEEGVPADALVEEHEGGTLSWHVAADGKVRAVVAGRDGKPVREGTSGTLAWKAASGEIKTIPLVFEARAGALVAAGPPLEGELTEIGYTLTVEGKPWSGTLHLPAGGTAELAASARAAASVELPAGALGPHGGTVTVVGGDRLELVSDEATGEVRVYVLGPDLDVVAVGERSVTLAVLADRPHLIVLAPAAGGLYLSGRYRGTVDPVRVTVSLRVGGRTHVAVVGHRPGVRLHIGPAAPRVKFRVKGRWEAGHDVNVKVKGKGPDARVKIDVKGPHVKGPDVKVKVKAPDVNVKAKVSAGASVKIK